MEILGVTGLMASGKSTVCRMLQQSYQISVFDADREVHKLLGQKNVRDDVLQAFPELCPKFKRSDLAEILKKKPANLKKLTNLLYPTLMKKLEGFILKNKYLKQKMVALDVPLLFESGMYKLCTQTLLVKVHRSVWKKRLLKRGYDEEDQLWRLSHQWSDAIKIHLATYSLDTSLGYGYTFQQVRTLYNHCTKQSGYKKCAKSSLIRKQRASAFQKATALWKSGA